MPFLIISVWKRDELISKWQHNEKKSIPVINLRSWVGIISNCWLYDRKDNSLRNCNFWFVISNKRKINLCYFVFNQCKQIVHKVFMSETNRFLYTSNEIKMLMKLALKDRKLKYKHLYIFHNALFLIYNESQFLKLSLTLVWFVFSSWMSSMKWTRLIVTTIIILYFLISFTMKI